MNIDLIRGLCYIAASILFIFGLKMLSSRKTARKGNLVSASGMLLAILATLTKLSDSPLQILVIIGVGAALGSIIGVLTAKKVKMTSIPEMVALFNGFGGLASLLIGWAEYHKAWGRLYEVAGKATDLLPEGANLPVKLAVAPFTVTAIFFTILIGGVTFSGSLIAYGKLAGIIGGKPVLFKGQNFVNGGILVGIVALGLFFVVQGISPEIGPLQVSYGLLICAVLLALVIGVLSIIPIGGADMPVVICLLNSYSGLAACAVGFTIGNNVLIVSGSLVGASGIILTRIMCKAMNRSLANVLFSGFGAVTSSGGGYQGEAKPISAEDAYLILEAADSIVFVPGYGMAAAQAQHVVCELGELLEKNGAEVQYCIHPVAGRMPGHMNVLLAEANVPYEQLVEPPDVNPNMAMVDVAVVVGSNDVVNPAARDDESSPLYGMPVINVDHARTCIVLKRSLNPGFAGVDNPLFFKENTRMLFGDAKASVAALAAEFKGGDS
jgi:H+-translocating NAD(P) transhydrogenase subunit beta